MVYEKVPSSARARRPRASGAEATLDFSQNVLEPMQPFSYNLTVGLKLQDKINKLARLWVKVVGQRDVDTTAPDAANGIAASSQVSLSGSAAAGVKFSF